MQRTREYVVARLDWTEYSVCGGRRVDNRGLAVGSDKKIMGGLAVARHSDGWRFVDGSYLITVRISVPQPMSRSAIIRTDTVRRLVFVCRLKHRQERSVFQRRQRQCCCQLAALFDIFHDMSQRRRRSRRRRNVKETPVASEVNGMNEYCVRTRSTDTVRREDCELRT